MTDKQLEQALLLACEGALNEAIADVADCDDAYVTEGTRSFADAGVLTYNAGIVLRLSDGSEFQLTIVQSR